jgi:hypothetical protein
VCCKYFEATLPSPGWKYILGDAVPFSDISEITKRRETLLMDFRKQGRENTDFILPIFITSQTDL